MEVFVLENKAAGEEKVAKEIEKVLDAIRALFLTLGTRGVQRYCVPNLSTVKPQIHCG